LKHKVREGGHGTEKKRSNDDAVYEVRRIKGRQMAVSSLIRFSYL